MNEQQEQSDRVRHEVMAAARAELDRLALQEGNWQALPAGLAPEFYAGPPALYTQSAARAAHHATEAGKAIRELIHGLAAHGDLPARAWAATALALLSEVEAILLIRLLKVNGTKPDPGG